LAGLDTTKPQTLTKDKFLEASKKVWPSEMDKMTGYFNEATNSGDKASKKQFMDFRNYLSNVGDTKCVLSFGNYMRLANTGNMKVAYQSNMACKENPETTCASRSGNVCTWRGGVKDCEAFELKSECPLTRCEFLNKKCRTVEPCSLAGSDTIHLDLKGEAKTADEFFQGKLGFASTPIGDFAQRSI
jgi:hypothetical protein